MKQISLISKKYYDNLFPLLYKGFSQKPYARYTCMPSFTNEYAFSVEKIENECYIISNSLSESYWYAEKKEFVKVITNKTEISNDLYLKIGELFKLLAEQTKEYDKDVGGIDGVKYYFTTTNKNGELKVGKTWSPDKNSLLGRLVKICDNMYLIGMGKNVSQSEVLKEISLLITDLKQVITSVFRRHW